MTWFFYLRTSFATDRVPSFAEASRLARRVRLLRGRGRRVTGGRCVSAASACAAMRRRPSTDEREHDDSRSPLVRFCAHVADSPAFNIFIFVVILANAVVLGLETYDGVVREAGGLLRHAQRRLPRDLRRRAVHPADRLRLAAAGLLQQRLERLRLPRHRGVVHAGPARERDAAAPRAAGARAADRAPAARPARADDRDRPLDPGRHEPRRSSRCSSCSSTGWSAGRSSTTTPRAVRVDQRGDADAVRHADAREPARPDPDGPRAVGLDDRLLHLLRAWSRRS